VILSLGSIGVGILIFVMSADEGKPLYPLALAMGGAAGLAAALLLCGLTVVLFPVRVGPAGLTSFNFWGMRRSVDWASVESVGTFPFLWATFLVVRRRDGGKLYVPEFLADPVAFLSHVRTAAGPDHAFTKAFLAS
jgi:hypothetical protein